MTEQPINVFIADDHQSIIDAFKAVLNREPDLSYIGAAIDKDELLNRLNGKIDVLLLDILVKGSDFLELIQDLLSNNPKLRILILSAHENLGFAKQTIEAGARGYLSKVLGVRDICNAIREVYRYPHMTLIKLPHPDTSKDERDEIERLLTKREIQVISLLCKGFPNNKEIAEFLSKINRKEISADTVQAHRRNIRAKLRDYGVTNDASLGYRAAIWGLLDGSELSSDATKDS